MSESSNRRTPKVVAAEQVDRVLTPEQKRELTIDTMASWALDGLHPTRETVENINAFLASGLTASEFIQKLKEKWPPAEGA
ncbi:antitoxin VbhA family protein [Arthrobacter sp. YAF17]|uniref:antitoxin VbhA family protein n=1 Tax=Arthrobacter sp. YAF17 TaxID=3233077 RepID=UPI003F917AE4